MDGKLHVYPVMKPGVNEAPEKLMLTDRSGLVTIAYTPERTAKRLIVTTGAVGRCNCSACNWIIDPYDAYCRRCGARLEER